MKKSMKLGTLQGAYEGATGTASENGRKLAYVGFAVIWVFRESQTVSELAIPRALWFPAIFLAIALVLDLLQYLLTATIYFIYFRKMEQIFDRALVAKGDGPSRDDGPSREEWAFEGSTRATWPGWAVFYFKMASLAFGWALLIVFLASRVPSHDVTSDTGGTGPRVQLPNAGSNRPSDVRLGPSIGGNTGGTGPKSLVDGGAP